MLLPVHWRESRARPVGRHWQWVERGMHWRPGYRNTVALPACPGLLGSTGCPQPPSHRRIYCKHTGCNRNNSHNTHGGTELMGCLHALDYWNPQDAHNHHHTDEYTANTQGATETTVIMYTVTQNWWAPCMPWITGIHRMPKTTVTQTNMLHTGCNRNNSDNVHGGTELTTAMHTQ